jgi:hypothetical protein
MTRKMLMVAALAVFFALSFNAHAEDNLFGVARLVVASGVEEREPVNIADSFAADIDKVYCFLEAQNIRRKTAARFVWYHGEDEVASVSMDLEQGSRWRTFSSVEIAERTGNWRVDLQDEADRVVQSVDFRVE